MGFGDWLLNKVGFLSDEEYSGRLEANAWLDGKSDPVEENVRRSAQGYYARGNQQLRDMGIMPGVGYKKSDPNGFDVKENARLMPSEIAKELDPDDVAALAVMFNNQVMDADGNPLSRAEVNAIMGNNGMYNSAKAIAAHVEGDDPTYGDLATALRNSGL